MTQQIGRYGRTENVKQCKLKNICVDFGSCLRTYTHLTELNFQFFTFPTDAIYLTFTTIKTHSEIFLNLPRPVNRLFYLHVFHHYFKEHINQIICNVIFNRFQFRK